jgi:hypothetical protein
MDVAQCAKYLVATKLAAMVHIERRIFVMKYRATERNVEDHARM